MGFLRSSLTGSAFRTGGCGRPPRDQFPYLSGLDLTTELLSQFVSPSFDHGIMGNPAIVPSARSKATRPRRLLEQPIQFLLRAAVAPSWAGSFLENPVLQSFKATARYQRIWVSPIDDFLLPPKAKLTCTPFPPSGPTRPRLGEGL